MRRRKASIWSKLSFFIVAAIIFSLVAYTAYGISVERGNYMRFGIDIKGGVSATFESADDSIVPTNEQLDAAKAVIEVRLDKKNILDRTVSIDRDNHCLIVEFPWQANETNYDPASAIEELGEVAQLSFAIVEEAKADEKDASELMIDGQVYGHYTAEETFMTGENVEKAKASFMENEGNVVLLTFNSEGTKIFRDITSSHKGDLIGIYMDDTLINVAEVQTTISEGEAYITGNLSKNEAVSLADKINSGALPFTMKSSNYSAVSATMGSHALGVMLTAGMIALIIIILFMTLHYRLPGFVASITLLLQTAGQLLIFHSMGLTLTLPGIAGIILSIGMGVDSNIIIAERIKEEINSGKTLRGAISSGYNRAFSAVLDCNITTGAVGVLLLIFGTGSMLSFAYTLLIGIFLNFGLSIISSKLMVQSLATYKIFSNPRLYGYKKVKEVE